METKREPAVPPLLAAPFICGLKLKDVERNILEKLHGAETQDDHLRNGPNSALFAFPKQLCFGATHLSIGQNEGSASQEKLESLSTGVHTWLEIKIVACC